LVLVCGLGGQQYSGQCAGPRLVGHGVDSIGLVNHHVAGAAELVDIPATGHTFERYASQEAAFEGKLLPFDDRVAQRIGQWFERHR
jgi:hypothetical protein